MTGPQSRQARHDLGSAQPAAAAPALAACGVRVARSPTNRAWRGARSVPRADRALRRDICRTPRQIPDAGPRARRRPARRRNCRRTGTAGCAPFLAHEQHRRRRREQQYRRSLPGFLRMPAWSSRSPNARLPIWSWFCRIDECGGGKCLLGSPLGSPCGVAMAPLEGEALGQAAYELRRRSIGIVAVIAVASRRSAAHAGVVRVVVPLRAVSPCADLMTFRASALWLASFSSTRCTWRSWPRLVAPALQVLQDVRSRVIGDRVHGVEPQPVEAVFLEPLERILDEEIAHLRHCRRS